MNLGGVFDEGGPGSGRHKTGKTAEKYGYNKKGGGGVLHHQGDWKSLKVHSDGSWTHHGRFGEKIGEGDNAHHLAAHLHDVHGKPHSDEREAISGQAPPIRDARKVGEGGPGSGRHKMADEKKKQKSFEKWRSSPGEGPRRGSKSGKLERSKADQNAYEKWKSKRDPDPKWEPSTSGIIPSLDEAAGGETPTGPYVGPRYDRSHPEGFEDQRYAGLKKGVGESEEGGPGSGPHSLGSPESKADGRVRIRAQSLANRFPQGHPMKNAMYKIGYKTSDLTDEEKALVDKVEKTKSGKETIGESQAGKKGWTARQRAMHSEMGKRIAKHAMESNRQDEPDDGTPRPIDLKTLYQKPEFKPGWSNNGGVYSPPIQQINEAMTSRSVEIKEF